MTPARQARPTPPAPTPPKKAFTGEVPRKPIGQRLHEWGTGVRARFGHAKRHSRWSGHARAAASVFSAPAGQPPARGRRRRTSPNSTAAPPHRPGRRRIRVRRSSAATFLGVVIASVMVTVAALELASVVTTVVLGATAEGLGVMACFLVCEPPPPKPRATKPRNNQVPGGYVKGGTCGSTQTTTGKSCGNPVAAGQRTCHLHGGTNPNGTGNSTPAAKAKAATATPPAKTRRTPVKPKPPAPAP